MTFPKISIVTPSYNQAKYIEHTILSVISQGYPNLEYIIIDGGSSDGTIDIIKKYENKIHYWISEKDNGLYDAINKGFQIASGEILAWINSDDVYLPNSFFTVAEIFTNFIEVQWLQGTNTHIDEYGRIVSAYPASYWTKYDLISGDKRNIQQESTFFRASLWKESGMPIDIKSQLAGDYSLWFTFFRFADLYTTTASIGCFRMRSSNQKSYNQLTEYNQEKKEIRKRNHKFYNCRIRVLLYTILHNIGLFSLMRLLKIEKKTKQLFFKGPKQIGYNRHNQKFEYI